MEQYRQGDILIERADMPPGLKRHEGVVVAEGEATGHKHQFSDESAVAVYDAPDGDLFADVSRDVSLVHEEHEAIVITPGVYRIRRQREYDPGVIRHVQD